MEDCIFCNFLKGEIPSKKIFENEHVYAFSDIDPQAPFHAVFIPKKHIKSADEINADNAFLIAEIFKAIALVAKEQGLCDGYRIVNNCGENAGQTVPHIHFHVMGKRRFSWPAG